MSVVTGLGSTKVCDEEIIGTADILKGTQKQFDAVAQVWSSDDMSWGSWGEQELVSARVPKAVPLGPGEAEPDSDFDWLFGQGEDGLLAMLKSHSESLGEGPAVAKLLACGFGVPFILHLNDFAWGANWTAVAVLGSKVQQSDIAS